MKIGKIIREIIGYAIALIALCIYSVWLIYPLFYLYKSPDDSIIVTLFAAIGYYRSGFWLYRKYITNLYANINRYLEN